MADLTPLDDARRLHTPPLQGRGRGWGLTANTLDELQRRATDMRRNPTEPEKRLWRALSNGQLEGFKFRRQAVIGRHIADFACAREKLIVEVDGDTHDDPAREAQRDAALAALGYHVVHVANAEVMTNLDDVLTLLLSVLRTSACAAEPHPNPSPEGEGPGTVEARKLPGISLEGSAGYSARPLPSPQRRLGSMSVAAIGAVHG